MPGKVTVTETLYVTNRDEWRRWLVEHHQAEREIWLIFYKKNSAKSRIPYDDAVEEALCFGWIDSLVQRIDDEKYAQKFTPRKPNSAWSASNRQRARQMLREGKMAAAGLATLPDGLTGDDSPDDGQTVRAHIPLPADLEQALRANSAAWSNYQAFTEKYQQLGLRWITAAKKPDTRARRIAEFVELTAQNVKIGMK